MIIRAQSFKAWMQANLDKQQIKELAEHGADAGWPGLTYYKDTCKLYERFKDEIWEKATEMSEDLGYKNVFAMMADWNGSANVGSRDQFENLMTWFMAEETARTLADGE